MDVEAVRIRNRLEVIRRERIALQLEEEALIEELLRLVQKRGETNGKHHERREYGSGVATFDLG